MWPRSALAGDRVFGSGTGVGGATRLWSAIGLPTHAAVAAPTLSRVPGRRACHWTGTSRTREMLENMPFVLGLHRLVASRDLRFPAPRGDPFMTSALQRPAGPIFSSSTWSRTARCVTLEGEPVFHADRPARLGTSPAPMGQHALLPAPPPGHRHHPVEFRAAAEGHEPHLKHHHDLLLANCLAQGEALKPRPHAGGGAGTDAGQGMAQAAWRRSRRTACSRAIGHR
jgi:glucose-6-phosphate isomerase